MTYTFPPGFSAAMNRSEIGIVYPTFEPEVHDLVDLMLATSDDRIQASHGLEDTPALAVQALAMSIGGRLPTYYHSLPYPLTEAGQTRKISREDTFTIAEGPVVTDGRHRFATVLERIIVPTEPEPPTEPGMLRTLFHMAASTR